MATKKVKFSSFDEFLRFGSEMSALEGMPEEYVTYKLQEFEKTGGALGETAEYLLANAPEQNIPELPMPEGEQARQARRRSLLKQRKRRGRESTILTSPMSLLSEEIGV